MPNPRRLVWFLAYLLTGSFCMISYAQEPLTPVTRIILPPIEKSAEKTGSFFPRALEHSHKGFKKGEEEINKQSRRLFELQQ